MRAWLTALAGLLACAAPTQAQEPTLAEAQAFARTIQPQLEAELDGARLRADERDPLLLHLEPNPQRPDGMTISLTRMFLFCRANPPADCTRESSAFIRNITARLETHRAENLRVIVRGADYAASVRRMEGATHHYPMRQIGEDLYALVAMDTPQTIEIITEAALADLGLSEEQAWDRAAAQTRAVIPDLPDAAELATKLQIYADQEYLPGILYPQSDWAEIAQQAGPDLFMAAVSDHLVVVGVRSEGPDLAELRAIARRACVEAPRCISPNVYRWRDGRWVIAP